MATTTEPHPSDNNNNTNDDTGSSSSRIALAADQEQQEWSQLMNHMAVTLDPKEYVQTFWQQGTRPDGRLFSQARATSIQKGILSHNNNSNNHVWGSALVTMGDTRVMAATTAAIGQATQQQTSATTTGGGVCGDVIVTLSLPSGESDATSRTVAPLEAYLQRLLDETLSLEQLSLAAYKDAFLEQQQQQQHSLSASGGKKHHAMNSINWNLQALRLHVTIQILHHAGNLWDATLLAAVAALQDTTLPDSPRCFVWDARRGRLALANAWDKSQRRQPPPKKLPRKPFQLPTLPIPLTLGLWWNKGNNNNNNNNNQNDGVGTETNPVVWMTDPTRLEEESGWLPSALTVVLNGTNSNDKNEMELVSLEYSGHHALRMEQDVLLALHMAQARAQEIAVLLK